MAVKGRIIVLGGTGWLGSHVVAALHGSGYNVLSVSRSAKGDQAQTLDLAQCTTSRLEELIAGAEAVINCTDAINRRDGRDRTSHELRIVNSELVAKLATAATRCSPSPLLIHMGSILEYGEPPGRACQEDDLCFPISDYARSKHTGTLAALAAREAGGRVVVLRLANLIGPKPATTTFPGILTETLQKSLLTKTPASLSVSADRRDFLDVRDAAAAAQAVVESPAACPPIVNVSSGHAVPVAEFVEGMVAVSGLPARLVDLVPRQVNSPGGDLTWADPTLARISLGWEPCKSFSESLCDMWTSASKLRWPEASTEAPTTG